MARSVLACTACLRRALKAPLASGGFIEAASLSQRPHSRRSLSVQARTTEDEVAAVQNAIKDAPQTLITTDEEGSSIIDKRNRAQSELYVKTKLKKIDDPWHIKQAVDNLINTNRFDTAVLLTEKASRTMETVASWNALIAHQMREQQIKDALKTFNNMKKRRQFPNVHTYTTIFDGLAKSDHPKRVIAEAVKHYNILLNDPRIEPTITHFNAVLNVCARAHDLDQMFLIASSLNEGSRKPNATTYTTILHGVRHKMMAELPGLEGEEADRYRQSMVEKGKGLWNEVMEKWSSGRLALDERTICAMGRIYFSDKKGPKSMDDNEFLELLEKTMNIPNYAKYPSANAARLALEQLQEEEAAGKKLSKARKTKQGSFVQPTQRTLGLVLEYLSTQGRSTLAIKYWNQLVSEFNIIPDDDNYFRMLLILKRAKSSAHIIHILEQRRSSSLHAGHFIVAMEACILDNVNPNALQNATAVLDQAEKSLELSDPCMPQFGRLFLRVALVSHHTFRSQARGGSEDAAREAYGRQIAKACARLWEPYKKLHYHWFKANTAATATGEDVAVANNKKPTSRTGKDANGKKKNAALSPAELRNMRREVIALARHVYGALNKILTERMLPDADLNAIRPTSAKINREIQKFYADREEIETRLNKKGNNAALGTSTTPSGASRGSRAAEAEVSEAEAELAQANEGRGAFESGTKRLGAEFVWDSRGPMGAPKKTRRSRPANAERREASTA